MYSLTVATGHDLAALSRLPVVLCGEAEPHWLRHRADYARLQPLFEADRKARRIEALREHRLVGRLRIVLGFA